MKISVNWLKELSGLAQIDDARVDVGALEPLEIGRRLTAAGLEVEGTTTVGAFSGVIVGEVRDRRLHPQADKLTLVDVFDGKNVTQVVCGAPNVPAPGGRVAWARPGARLPNGVVMAARDVRGVVSPGMLCAEDELGLGTSHEGILLLDEGATPGMDVATLLGLPDVILKLNVTPNRPDCLGHLGVAREAAALFAHELGGRGFQIAEPQLAPFSDDQPVHGLAAVELVDVAGCPRYLARVLTGVKVGPSPLRLRVRLQSLGLRAINNVVDATNLVLMETGHPLHAFDLDRLEGGRIVVRGAAVGETIVTLDGQERPLRAEDLAICDAHRPVAIAGVMGGRDSEVTASTTRILLESAAFDARRIRRTGKRLGLHSEAAHRFERGVDPNAGVEHASARCAQLIAELSSARVARGVIDVYPRRVEPARVELRAARTERVLGVRIDALEQARIVGSIGVAASLDGETLRCVVPTFRPDLTREIDLVEEIARLHGYDSVPATLPRTSAAPGEAHPGAGLTTDGAGAARRESVRAAMAALGFAEAITYAFIAPARIAAMGHASSSDPSSDVAGDVASDVGRDVAHAWRARPLRIENPLREEHSALRTSVLPNLLDSLQHNLAHGALQSGQSDHSVRLFEVGTIFRRCARGEARPAAPHLPARGRDELLPEEHTVVAGVMAGRRPGWLKPGEELDFFDCKGVVAALVDALRIPAVSYRAALEGAAPWLHPGQGAALLLDGSDDKLEATAIVAGHLGEVHPDVRARFGLETRVFAFEIDLRSLGAPAPIGFKEAPRFPGSARDISFFVDRAVPAADLKAALSAASTLIETVRVLEDYREPGKVPAGKKGMLLSLYYRSRERTLTDAVVADEHERVVADLKSRFNIEPR